MSVSSLVRSPSENYWKNGAVKMEGVTPPPVPSASNQSRQYVHSRGAPPQNLVYLRESLDDFWRVARVVVPALLLFGCIIVASTLGYVALGWKPFDALYMVVITVFGVGFGEIQPVDAVTERVWTMLVILSGWTGVVVTLGGITKAVTEGELRRATDSRRKLRQVEHLHDHVIICGYGRMGATLARELTRNKVPFVIIDRDEERVAQIQVDGFVSLRGDATDEGVLESAGILRARALATVLPQDALNVFITLTARNLAKTILIIARGEQPSTEKKLLQAGANEVILPAQIGAMRIANSIVEPSVSRFLSDADHGNLRALGVEIDELALHAHAHLVGKTVAEVQKLARGEVMVLGIRRGAEVLRDHLPDEVLQTGDALIAISRNAALPTIIGRDVERIELI